jgi:hypothetical protein
LIAAVFVGSLTMLATFAGALVNWVSGTAALAIATTGAVLAGTASIIATIISGISTAPSDAAISEAEPAPARAPRPPRAQLHPLEAIRGVRLPIACVLMISGAALLPQGTFVMTLETGEQEDWGKSLQVWAFAWVVIVACLVQGLATLVK